MRDLAIDVTDLTKNLMKKLLSITSACKLKRGLFLAFLALTEVVKPQPSE